MNPSIKSVGINAQIFSDLRDRFFESGYEISFEKVLNEYLKHLF
jgi:hypothetical protein